MKRFSKWEEREERKMHADLRHHQPGVLFLDRQSADPIAPGAPAGVLHVPEKASSAQPAAQARSSSAAAARRPRRVSAFAAAAKGKGPAAAEPPPLPPRRLDRSSVKGLVSVPPPAAAADKAAGSDALSGSQAEEPLGTHLGDRHGSAPAELPHMAGTSKGKEPAADGAEGTY